MEVEEQNQNLLEYAIAGGWHIKVSNPDNSINWKFFRADHDMAHQHLPVQFTHFTLVDSLMGVNGVGGLLDYLVELCHEKFGWDKSDEIEVVSFGEDYVGLYPCYIANWTAYKRFVERLKVLVTKAFERYRQTHVEPTPTIKAGVMAVKPYMKYSELAQRNSTGWWLWKLEGVKEQEL